MQINLEKGAKQSSRKIIMEIYDKSNAILESMEDKISVKEYSLLRETILSKSILPQKYF